MCVCNLTCSFDCGIYLYIIQILYVYFHHMYSRCRLEQFPSLVHKLVHVTMCIFFKLNISLHIFHDSVLFCFFLLCIIYKITNYSLTNFLCQNKSCLICVSSLSSLNDQPKGWLCNFLFMGHQRLVSSAAAWMLHVFIARTACQPSGFVLLGLVIIC